LPTTPGGDGTEESKRSACDSDAHQRTRPANEGDRR
jgi:hypothetical protein